MHSFIRLTCSALILLGLAACSGVETRPEATDTFAAGNYQYYRWRSEPLDNTSNSSDPIYALDPVIRREVDNTLRSKGYVLNDARAQFTVDYVYAAGTRMGQKGSEASNLSTYPGVIPNRNVDQASVDNAYALGGVKETNNVGIQLNDATTNEEVWMVIITKIVENVNLANNPKMNTNVQKAVHEGLRSLPKANH